MSEDVKARILAKLDELNADIAQSKERLTATGASGGTESLIFASLAILTSRCATQQVLIEELIKKVARS